MKSALITIVIGMGICISSLGQTLQDFEYLGDEYQDHIYLGIGAKYNWIHNKTIYNHQNHNLKSFGGEIQMKRHDFRLGKRVYSFEYKLLGDLAFILHDQINSTGKSYYRQESTGLTNGLLGWHSVGWNFIARDYFTVAAGLNINDYFYASSYTHPDSTEGKLYSTEPQGYYFAAGPSIFSDVLLTRFLVLHMRADYAISYWKPVSLSYGISDPNYPMPHFVHFSSELVTPIGIFLEWDHAFIINRGNHPNNGVRNDISLGFKFVL